MLDIIEYYDRIAFHHINGIWRNDIADVVMPFMRTAKNWYPFYLLLVGYSFLIFKKNAWKIILFIVLSASIADATSSRVVKKIFQRTRPCKEVSLVPQATVQVPCNSFSFTSSHAASHYALALSMSLSLFRRKKIMEIILFTWAATIGYAQIYVGVHYPFDIICGALLGIGIVFALNRIPFFNFKT